MSSKDSNTETIEMDMKEEMNSTENTSGEEFTRETKPTLEIDEIEIKHEEMDFHLHHNSTQDDQSEDKSDLDVQTMCSIGHVECESTEAEEKDLKDFYHDILLCDRDCETCIKYMGMLSDHVRTTHVSHQSIQDPLLIDPVPVPLTGQSSSPIQIKSEVDENIVKMELDCSDPENTSGDEFIRESETALDVDKIEIKQEELDFYLHHNSTADVHSEGHSHASIEHLSRIAHFECGSTKAEEKDLNNFYNDILKCERDCGTCLKYMRMLSEHVRATHPPQPIQDRLLIDPVTLTDQSSSFDENIVKIELDCSDHEEVTVPNSDSDPDCNIESDSESDPAHAPSSSTKKLRRQGQCLAANHASSLSRSLKPEKENLPQFKCEKCGKSFKRKILLREHMRVHSVQKPFKCDVCDKGFIRRNQLTEHMRVYTGERPFKCNLCEKSFTAKCSLTSHMRTHAGGKPFLCDVCGKMFTTSSELTVHMRIHTGEKPFKCDMCLKGFPRSSELTAHKRIHTGENPFQCDVCGKRFTTKCTITTHMRIHTGDKPFKCDVCGKRYPRSSDLTQHTRFHTGENPFKCGECEKSFARKGDLTVHMRFHTGEKPFKCDVCEKSFARKGHLTVHTRIHTGEKCFQCDICVKSFTQKSNLYSHKRIHSGERPYKCDQCEKSFTKQVCLTDHKKIHT